MQELESLNDFLRHDVISYLFEITSQDRKNSETTNGNETARYCDSVFITQYQDDSFTMTDIARSMNISQFEISESINRIKCQINKYSKQDCI